MSLCLNQIKDDSEFDVVIVGAGMVGACTALGLSQIGVKVLLLDSFAFNSKGSTFTPSYDARSTALSYGTKEILCQLGIWSEIAQYACIISDVHVSEKGHFGTTRMSADEFNQPALGYVVPNVWLGECLMGQIEQRDIEFCHPVKVTHIQNKLDRQQLCLSSDDCEIKKVNTRLLVITDGSDSDTAKLVGIGSDIKNYAQYALIANVSTELPNNGIAYERFTPKGPIALLPISDYGCSLVWTHDESEIESFMTMDEALFCQKLGDEFGERLGRIEKCGERMRYPLKLIRSKEQCRDGILLLGNAAHSLHPVAGQGFNLAIRGVAAFLEMVAESLNDKDSSVEPFECFHRLDELCRARSKDQTRTIFLSDQLIKIFGSKIPALSLIRDLGLISLGNTPGLKSMFAAQTMGLSEKKTHFGLLEE